MLDWIMQNWEKFTMWVAEGITEALGNSIVNLGSCVEQMAILGIVVGIFLIRFRNTKVLRYSFISYLISLLIELFGLAILKK